MRRDIYWPDDGTWERLRAAAAEKGLSISEYLRKAAMAQVQRDERRAAADIDAANARLAEAIKRTKREKVR